MSGLEQTIQANTLIDILKYRSVVHPNKIAYTFLLDGESDAVSLTYQELDTKARAIAAYIQSLCAPQDRVLLLYPPGLGFIEAFFACLYADTIAVPAYPPRPNRSIGRIQSIIKDAKPTLALTTHSILQNLQRKAEITPELKTLRWLSTDNINLSYGDQYQESSLASDNIAFLQYTSGSTAEPKGVKIAHDNLLHNLHSIYRCFQHNSQSVGVIWLPPYHDMGLIGGILQPLYGNFPVVLMPPLMFLQNPLRWLRAISHYRATTSGGPNFAYDLCWRKFKPEPNLDLDLSSWDLAFNGAEPINYETLEKFAATFAPYGFSHKAFYPCYGMAEATLIVSGGKKNSLVNTKTILAEDLQQDKVTLAHSTEAYSRTLVSCGHSLPDQQIIIVEPETSTVCEPGKIGEIWVAGSSIARGYWNQQQTTEDTFKALIPDFSEGVFLRTGDLGFIEDGELYVTGRIKDIIIIKGRNHYPQDIEKTVEASSSHIRPYCSASFSINVGGEEKLVIVAEVNRSYRERRKSNNPEADSEPLTDHTQEILRSIRRHIFQQHDLQVHKILLLKPGSIPKTSSGKIQRHACCASFLDGSLNDFTIGI